MYVYMYMYMYMYHLERSKQGFVLADLCTCTCTIQNHLGNQHCTVISPFKTTIANGFKWCINLYEKGTKSRRVNQICTVCTFSINSHCIPPLCQDQYRLLVVTIHTPVSFLQDHKVSRIYATCTCTCSWRARQYYLIHTCTTVQYLKQIILLSKNITLEA